MSGVGEVSRSPARHFAIGLARAVGGAAIFGLPMLMTMEMWSLGATIHPLRLALLVVVAVPMLVGLSHVAGFEPTFELREDVADAFVAYAVGFVVGAAGLALVGALPLPMPLPEATRTIALQAVPGSIGALLAQSQLGAQQASDEAEEARGARPSSYASQLVRMAAGALFLAFNVAPTEEMVLIAYRMTTGEVLALVAISLAVMHAFVFALEFSGQESAPPGTPEWQTFLRFTIVGYAIALLISAYVLWTFGRLDDTAWVERVTTVLVLGFPAAIGAAAARLIL